MPAESRDPVHRFELIETLVLAVAVVLTAWAAFQSTKWSGVQADSYSRAAAARVESTRIANAAGQHQIVDTDMFTAWVGAVASEVGTGQDLAFTVDGVYRPVPGTTSAFLYERFRDGFRPHLDAWLATRPLHNPDAPATPFDMPGYEADDTDEAATLAREAEELATRAREANQNGDNYVLMTIMFAMVIVLAGFGSKMHTVGARFALDALAITVLVTAIVVVISFPVEI